MMSGWTDLPDNYTNAVFSGMRKYRIIENGDGSVSFQDVTDYTQRENSFFNANDANSMNGAINEIMNNKGEMFAVDDAPSDNKTYGRKNGAWSEVTGSGGSSSWGNITGSLSDQTDLQNALDDKAASSHSHGNILNNGRVTAYASIDSSSRLLIANNGYVSQMPSSMAFDGLTTGKALSKAGTWEDFLTDASSDNKTYGRKNGVWSEITPGTGVTDWGEIEGSLSDQTDLQTALNEKLFASSVVAEFDSTESYPSGWNYVTYQGVLWRFTGPFQGDWEDISTKQEITLDYIIGQKANTADLGDVAALDAIDYTGNYLTNKPTLGGMSAIDDAPSDGKYYGRKNGSWYEVIGDPEGRVDWGEIAGSLSSQTDLYTVLQNKLNQTSVIAAFDTTTSYPSGWNYVTYEGDLWKIFGPCSGDWEDIATKEQVTIDYLLSLKSNVGHTHDDRYYTESETDTLLSAKAPLDSPALTGSPTAPTQTAGDASTKIATTAYVDSGLSGKAPRLHIHDDRYYTTSEIDTELAKKVNRAGDMMNGVLSVRYLEDDITVTPSGNIYPDFIVGRDKNGVRYGSFRGIHISTGIIGTSIYAQRTVSDTTYYNDLELNLTTTGSCSVYVTDPAAWRSAIGAAASSHTHDDRYYTESEIDTKLGDKVDKAGDTMTGTLTIAHTGEVDYHAKRTDVTLGTAPSGDGAWLGAYCFKENTDNILGYVGHYYSKYKNSFLRFNARNKYNGTTHNHYFDLGVDSSNTDTLAFSNEPLWRKTLFKNDLSSSAGFVAAFTNTWQSGGYIQDNKLFQWMGAGPSAQGDAYGNANIMRVNVSAGQTLVLHEGNIQRSALIITTNGSPVGMAYWDRWGNWSEILPNSYITRTWTGAVNTLGTLKLKNTSSGYIQIFVIYPSQVFTKYTTE